MWAKRSGCLATNTVSIPPSVGFVRHRLLLGPGGVLFLSAGRFVSLVPESPS